MKIDLQKTASDDASEGPDLEKVMDALKVKFNARQSSIFEDFSPANYQKYFKLCIIVAVCLLMYSVFSSETKSNSSMLTTTGITDAASLHQSATVIPGIPTLLGSEITQPAKSDTAVLPPAESNATEHKMANTEFGEFYLSISALADGFLGKIVGFGMILFGLGAGLVRQDIIQALLGIAGGCFLLCAPQVINQVLLGGL